VAGPTSPMIASLLEEAIDLLTAAFPIVYGLSMFVYMHTFKRIATCVWGWAAVKKMMLA